MIRLANLNTYKLRLDQRGTPEWQARVTTICEINADILELQEIRAGESAGGPGDRESPVTM
ncbi:hypothetical protein [Streptomyces nigrescens]